MPLEMRLAWRNVWRNPRRTALTVAATVFAVVLVVFSVALSAGSHQKMIEDSVRTNAGHVQVSGVGYQERQTLEQFLVYDESVAEAIAGVPGIEGQAPRVVSFGLVSQGDATRGIGVLGVSPEREPTVTTLADRVVDGRFLRRGGEREIVLGGRLAEVLGASIGDEVLLYGIAYSLETAYDLFRVVGVLQLPEAEMDRSLALISLDEAQRFFVYGDRVSEVAVVVDDSDAVSAVAANLRRVLPSANAEVHTWRETMAEIEQVLLLDKAGMYLTLGILVVVVGFGILNTILMAVLERQRELGVVLALGLRPGAVFRVVYLESLFLALFGLAIGVAVAVPLVAYLQSHPIPVTSGEAMEAFAMFGIEPAFTWKLRAGNPLGTMGAILAVALLAALYPAVKASRGRPVDVLRSL